MKTGKFERKINSDEKGSPFLYILKGTAIAYAITLVVFIVYAILLTYTDTTEENIKTIVMVTVVVSVLVSGYDSARGIKNRRLIWGVVSGLVYSIIMIGVGFCIVPDYTFSITTLINLILCIAGGGFGGILSIVRD